MNRTGPLLPKVLLVVAALMLSGFCGEQSRRETIVPLTIEAAAREAVAWHPSVTEASGVLAARGEEIGVARAGYLPQISAGVGAGYDNRISANWRPRPQVSATQMLHDFGKTASAVQAARAGVDGGRAELLLAIDTLIRDTGTALIELQRVDALEAVARDQLGRISQIRSLVDNRTSRGAATRSDSLQAQARVEAAEATLMQLEAEQRRWASNLAFLTGREKPPEDVAADVPDWLMKSCDLPPPPLEEVPAVMVADARQRLAAANLRRSRAERYPTLGVGGDASTDIASPLGDQTIYSFGLRVTGNVFSGNITRARVRGAGFALEAAEAAVARARNDTSQRLAEATQQIDALTRLTRTLAARQANMEETGKLYRLQYLEMGTRTLVDLLNAEQEFQQVRFDAVNTAHDLRRLEVDCLFLTGRMRTAFGLAGTRVRGVML